MSKKNTIEFLNPGGSALFRRIYALTALLVCSVLFMASSIVAQDTYWEGGISISPYGKLPRSGNYAASNAFPQDTKVTVTNTETGKSVELRVVERLDDPHLFMLVSPEAGEALGMREDEVVRGTVAPTGNGDDLVGESMAREQPYSADPELNPSAAMKGAPPVDDSEGLAVLEEFLEEDTGADAEAPSKGPEIGAVALIETPGEDSPGKEAPAEAKEPRSEEAETPSADNIKEVMAQTPPPGVRPHQPTAPEKRTGGAAEAEGRVGPEPDMGSIEGGGEAVLVAELPSPVVHEGRKAATVELPPGEEPSEGPKGDAVEPLFVESRGGRFAEYAPVNPEPPVELEEKAGPTASLAYSDGEAGEEEYFAAAEPRVPEVEKTSPELAKAEPREEELDLAAVHSPEAELLEERPEESPAAQEAEEADEEKAPIPEEADLVLRPAEERPPEAGPDRVTDETSETKAKEAEKTEPKAKARREPIDEELIAGAKFTERLTESSYYLQLAAYQELETAKALAVKFLPRYPVTIYKGESGTFPYKVMVGPLNEDESGAMLYSFSSRGYRDAFLRRGN